MITGTPIHPKPIKPTTYSLGGAQFFGRDKLLLTVQAGASPHNNEAPIALHACSGGHRTMIDMSTEEAEALANCLVTTIRLRREAEGRFKAEESRRARTFFQDSDGLLESA